MRCSLLLLLALLTELRCAADFHPCDWTQCRECGAMTGRSEPNRPQWYEVHRLSSEGRNLA